MNMTALQLHFRREISMKSILQGMVIGIANIMPGVSGGTLMVAMGIYDKLLHCITHLFSEFKQNLPFLLPIALGMGIAVIAGTFGLEFFFGRFPLQTNLLFIGLIVGGLPAIWKKVRGRSIRIGHLTTTLIFFSWVFGMALLSKTESAEVELTFTGIHAIKLFGVGMIAAATMVVPGVSGSMVLMLMGYYHPIINTVNDLVQAFIRWDTERVLNGLGVLIPFGIGLGSGIFLIAKLVEVLFQKFPLHAYWAIIGLIAASPFAIFFMAAGTFQTVTFVTVATGGIALFAGFVTAYKLGE